MLSQLAERIRIVTVAMSPHCLVDKFLNRLDKLRGAMALDEIDGLARSEMRTRVLFD